MKRAHTSRWSLLLFPACAVLLFLAVQHVPSGPGMAPDNGADATAPTPEDRGTSTLGTSRADRSRITADTLSDAAGAPRGGAKGAILDETEARAHIRDGLPLTADHPLVAPVIRVQEKYTQALFRHPLVVGVATGTDARGDVAVIVLTRTQAHDLPRFLDGVPVEQHVSGDLVASRGGPPAEKPGGGGGGSGKDESVDPTARFDRPVPIGVSTGHPDVTAGTIGCRVTDGNNVFALSNNHVYANEGAAAIDDAVIQPGTFDGGLSTADDIGTLEAFVEISFLSITEGGKNSVDAAIALTDTDTLSTATPSGGYGTPLSTTYAPAINLRVRKYGRTTGDTKGKVYAINASVNVGYGAGTAGFVGQIIINPGAFSSGGDSGSLIVVQKGSNARKPVGLLFAGSSSVTIASPIDDVLDAFTVTIDGE